MVLKINSRRARDVDAHSTTYRHLLRPEVGTASAVGAHEVGVDEANGAHQRVHRGRADEAEALALEALRQSYRLGRHCGDLGPRHRGGRDLGLVRPDHLGEPEVTPTPMSWAEVPAVSPESVGLAKRLKREGFRFVGPTTMYALVTAVGIVDTHLMGSHRRGCSGLWPE